MTEKAYDWIVVRRSRRTPGASTRSCVSTSRITSGCVASCRSRSASASPWSSGFAGGGRYDDGTAGSPLRIFLEGLRDAVTAIDQQRGGTGLRANRSGMPASLQRS